MSGAVETPDPTAGATVGSSPIAGRLPIVAIVGRPNVGKSTLFNRYTGASRALVEDRPGITRDRIAAEVELDGRELLLVDTAGLDPEAREGIGGAVQEQARIAVAQADAIVFVVDGRSGLTPEDEEIARALRRGAKPVALAVNKMDNPAQDALLGDFYRLGFPHVGAVSAEHGRGAFALLEELAEELPVVAPCEASDPATRVAIVGRPNAGKSSLLNRLLGAERVVVSPEPGTTRDAVDIRISRGERDYVFVDTAGLRRPGRRHRVAERASAVMTLRALERAGIALVVIDSTEGVTDQDTRILSLARERGCAVVVLLNKWDLLEEATPTEKGRLADELDRRLRGFGEHPVLRISAQTGKGVKRLYPMIDELWDASGRRIATAELNRWLQDCVRRHEPAMAQKGNRKRPVKFYYATQTGVHPPRISLFCNDPDAVMKSYVRFLENRFREAFDIHGVPIRLRLRARRADTQGRPEA